MKTLTVEEAGRDITGALAVVEAGESVAITRKGRPVAHLVPAEENANADEEESAYPKPDWSGYLEDLKAGFGGRIVGGTPMHEIVSEGRGD